MSRRKFINVIVIFLIIAGLSLILYPMLSDYLKTLAFQRAIRDYSASVAEIGGDTYEKIFEAARAYNAKLAARGTLNTEMNARERLEYESLLDINGTGIMGYVEIDKINVSLPIYHGTDEAALQSGVGHLEGSSLPVGGESTHAVISGHSGLPSAMLFTNLDRLTTGDTFTIRVLSETLTYEVDQILTVLPNESEALNITEGEDQCTLLTCTPYGVNSHRLLVRGHRTYSEEQTDTDDRPTSEDIVQKKREISPLMTAAAAVGAMILALPIVTAVRRGKMKKRNIDDNKNNEKI